MQYREYGLTGKKVSVIGLGGMRFPADEAEGVRAMIRAAELGINYFDTAPHYCNDRSEPIFGMALKQIKNPVYISTKSSISEQRTADEVRRRIEYALERMGTEKIHFFHMWCIMSWKHFEDVMSPGGPYEGALKAKEEGLIDHIVFSTHANGMEIRKMCETKAFEGVTLGYNLFNHTNRHDGILAAYENNMGVAVMNPLGGGMIPAAQDKLQFIQKNKNDTVVQAALRFVASHPEITVTLAGMGTVAHVEENAQVGDDISQPDRDLVEAIKQQYQELGDAFCTACSYCLPCPQQIEIPAILSALNRHHVGMEKAAQGYYQFFKKMAKDNWVPASSCNDCGLCESKCTQRLAVRKLLKEAAGVFETF